MKHGRRLTRAEKILLKKEKYDPNDFLRLKRLPTDLTFVNRTTGKILAIRY